MVRTKDEKAVWRREIDGAKEEKTTAAVDEKVMIRKGEEILNHYCDIGIDVRDRREWAVGALGGLCRCARCQWEAAEN